MLSIEQIENIIKSKYKDVEIDNKNYEESLYIRFDNKSDNFFKNYKLISVEKEKMDTFYYAECSGEYGEDTADISFKIENNAIELKHCLDIKITKQDMIDWLETFTSEYNSSYHIYTKTNPCLYVYTSLEDIDGKKRKCFGLLAWQYTEEVNIFQATNSQEYWRLYNIIKNLKG